MILAEVGDTPYNIILLLHLLTVIVGVGAAFVGPIVAAKARQVPGAEEAAQAAVAMVMAPSLLAAGVFGGALVGFSDDAFDFGQTWLAIAAPLWIVSVALAAFVAPPSYVGLPEVPEARRSMLGGLLHLSLAAMLVIMVWQPGL